ncbi:MAG: hypothetical protein ACJ74Z_19585 [Bryobacteraceae bacterium]
MFSVRIMGGGRATRARWEIGSPRKTLFSLALLSAVTCMTSRVVWGGSGSHFQEEASQHELKGDLSGARSVLEQAAGTPGDSSGAAALAEFLERHDDPGSRDAYVKWASEESDPAKRKLALRHLVLLDFMEGRNSELQSDLDRYGAVGGDDLRPPAGKLPAKTFTTVTIPGPLSSFARMAALSPDLGPEELLPSLARNVVTNGYEASGNEALQQTEYLRLLIRYVGQARELQAMTNKDRKIVIPNCDSEETGKLLKALGYRMRGSCGADIVLETVNATRAFLTIDSGFPLTELEQDLRANRRFELAFASTQVPVLYSAEYWLSALGKSGQADFLDAFLSDPSLCRLYLGLSRLDRATAEAVRKEASPAKLKVYAHVLDFFGSMFQIRNGAAVVPGSPKLWASLVGVPPTNPGAFFDKLITVDDGWLASYFDALSRLNGPAFTYLTQPDRTKRFYDALRGKITSPGPARPVFRSSTELLLLTSSLQIDANGQPHVPGNLDVWRNLFIKHPHGKYDGRLTRSASSWRTNDDLLEALFGLSRKTVENEPLKIFLTLNDIDRDRLKPISAQLAARLVAGYRNYGAQYILFADVPSLTEASMGHYLDTCADMSSIRDGLVKADAIGTLQALVEIWEILSRQNMISPASEDATFAKLIEPFSHVRQQAEVFNAGRSGVGVLLSAAGARRQGPQQEQLVELLVGKVHASGGPGPFSPAENFLRIFDAQRLIRLDSLFTVADGIGKGPVDQRAMKNIDEQLGRLEDTESLRGSLSSAEKNAMAVGYWSQRHLDQERKVSFENLAKNSEKREPGAVLAPFLRDSLVGLVYCYYAPAGAQLLLTNPLFVRGHDFVGPPEALASWRATEIVGSGWPASTGGRLMGSLTSLPYAIAEAEQNFLTPKREQALIWADLVPQMIVDVTVTRWRNVKPEQVRWVSLHIQRGRSLIAAAALDPTIQSRVFAAYARFATPARVERLRDELNAGDFQKAVSEVPTSELYALAQDSTLRGVSPDVASNAITVMADENNPDLAPVAIARVFGTPKPTLTHSYRPGLLYLRTFPALMGYSSRILAESWESNNLYYAALADQVGVPIDQLDSYVPEWNRSAIENIFATHLEDWPAVLRSLHAVGENVRQRNNQRAAINTSQN